MTRTFLLTGVTGFLGKVLLEELVRRRTELGIERIGVVIRPMRGLGAEERFRREVVRSHAFDGLAEHWSDIVTVLEGNLEHPAVGLQPDSDAFIRTVTHVVHAAASVKFNLPVAQAARANITASLNMLELAQRMPRLERFVYVSTAYVTPERGRPIEEELVGLSQPASELYDACLNGSMTEAELLARTGHPNSYTMTKALAEHLLAERRGSIPLTIMRPSIITAARETPMPGWIDSTAGYAAFVMFVGTGHLRALVCDPHARLDLVPVDDVTHRIVDASVRDDAPVIVRHAVAGLGHAPDVLACWDVTSGYYRVRQIDKRPDLRYMGPRGARFALTDLVQHRLPVALAGLESKARKRQAVKRGARLAYLNEEFAYFTTRSFDFRSSIPIEPSFDEKAYLRTVCAGVYKHILKLDEGEWLLGGRAHAGNDGDLRWALTQPRGNFWIRTASWLATKIFRRSVEAITVDVTSFEQARGAIPAGTALVLTPSHRSYLDFVLTTYLAFNRPDLVPIPHIAATMEFARIPVLGRILQSMHAFYLRRGAGKDPELAGRVAALLDRGDTLAFFIEGARSRTGEFLQPRRGLLRCLQASGRPVALMPIAISYDRVPEQAAFDRELAGHPKQKMSFGGLIRWSMRAWRGEIDLGDIHIACGAPVMLDAASDVHAVSHEVINQLRGAMLCPPDAARSEGERAFQAHREGSALAVAEVTP